MMFSGINLVMTVIGFAVSSMFIVFVCTRLICARIQLRNARRAFATSSRSDLSILERGIHGLKPVVVASFPTKKFGELFEPGQDALCTVCLSEYQEKDVLRLLPLCGHTFHATCIDIWLKQHCTCPVCRVSLRDSPERKRLMHPIYSPSLSSSETSASDPCRFQFGGAIYSPRSEESDRMVSIEEDQLTSVPIGTRGSTLDINCSSKNDCNYQLKEHMESPSY